MNDVVKLRGAIELVLSAPDGTVIERKQENTVVTAGRAWALKQLASGHVNTAQAISHVAVGTSTTAPSTADTTLAAENTRKSCSFDTSGLTSSTPWWRAEVVYNTNEANTTLGEVGLFNSSSGGTMLARATFGTINKTTSNTLNVSYTISG